MSGEQFLVSARQVVSLAGWAEALEELAEALEELVVLRLAVPTEEEA